MSAKSFTERQGQYLAFIDAYTRVHGRPPAETDMQPQPAFRAPDGPHAGAPRPHPPPARRRAQHRGAPRPPRLARSASPPTGQIHCAEELARLIARSRRQHLIDTPPVHIDDLEPPTQQFYGLSGLREMVHLPDHESCDRRSEER